MAINFGAAGEYNVFVLGGMNMSNTDAEGRVAVGGSAVLSNYGVGAGVSPLPPAGTDPSFVVAGNVNVSGGSNACGNTVVSPDSTVTLYTMGNPNGTLITGTPIDFSGTGQYLKCASAFWNTLPENGTGEVVFNQLNLTGTDPALNIFRFDSMNLYGTGLSLSQLNGINIIAPADSTILINVTGGNVQYGSYQIFRNGVAATRENARKILWNYPEALTWSNSTTAIYGSVLAPFAAAVTTYSQINGNIIFDSYTGNAESHNELFTGELPDPTACAVTSSTTTDSTSSTTSSTSSSTSSTTSSTSSTTTTSTTTSSTTTTTTTTPVPALFTRCQAISDLYESVALQQAALAHILNAEGEKLQKILSFENVSWETVLKANRSVESMVESVGDLELILKQKLELFRECTCEKEK